MAAGSKTFEFKFTGDADNLRRATSGVETDMDGLGGKLSNSAKRIAGFIAGAFVVDKIIEFGTALYNIGAEAELWEKKAQVVFGDQIGLVQTWADAQAGAMGLTSMELTGLAANMADLLVPMGMTREQAAQMSMDVTGLSGALSAWSGGTRSSAEVQEILSKAILGERDALTSLGIKISQAEVDQRALTLAQADGRTEITQLDQALATQQLIMEKSTDAQTAWADGTMDSTKRANELKAQVEELKEKLGTALLPVIQSVTAWILDSFIPALTDLKEWIWPKLQAAHDSLSGWWDEHGPGIIAFAESVRDAAIDLGEGFLSMWNDHISPALTDLKAALDDLWAKVQEIQTNITGSTEGMGVDWEKVGRVVAMVVTGAIAVLTTFISYVTVMASNVGTALTTVIGWWNQGRDTMERFATAVANIYIQVRGWMTSIGSAFESAGQAIRGAITNAQGAFSPFIAVLDRVVAALRTVKGWFDDVKAALGGKISIPTPSWPKPPSWMKGLIPGFHSGTHSVPGAPGTDVPAILQAGERVISVAQTRHADRQGGGGQTIVINAYGTTGREMVAEIERAVRDGVRANWLASAGVV